MKTYTLKSAAKNQETNTVWDAFVELKIPEQTEPLFRGKLNQMLKDGFANQI